MSSVAWLAYGLVLPADTPLPWVTEEDDDIDAWWYQRYRNAGYSVSQARRMAVQISCPVTVIRRDYDPEIVIASHIAGIADSEILLVGQSLCDVDEEYQRYVITKFCSEYNIQIPENPVFGWWLVAQ
jgi:hypothetical protein